jgi:hypothetical protein
MKNLLSWKVGLTALAVIGLIAWRVYDQTPHYRKIKDEDRIVPHDMVVVERLPVLKPMKLKVVARARDGRPLHIYWLDGQQKELGTLCESGDLSGGAELELAPGQYSLCFELAANARGGKSFNLQYSLYEYR